MKKFDKKTALICNYYILNYGSVLQSYALYYSLKKLGHAVEVVQFRDRATKKQKIDILLRFKIKKLFSRDFYKNYIIKKMAPDFYYKTLSDRRAAFDKFINEHLKFTEKFDSIADIQKCVHQFKQFVLSSDQLWSPEDIIRSYHTLQWLPENAHSVAYATSFGVEKVSDYIKKKVKVFIPRITFVSVREQSGANIIQHSCGRVVPVVMDPTLLLSQDEWSEIISEKTLPVEGEYIFVYLLGANYENFQRIKEFSKEVSLPIVSIPYASSYQKYEANFSDYTLNGDPADFVNLIQNAKYVVGDSFHMCVFSIIFRKQFLVMDRYSNNGFISRNTRIDNLLGKFHLEDRRVRQDDNVAKKMAERIDYQNVDAVYQQWYGESMDYLKNSVDNAR